MFNLIHSFENVDNINRKLKLYRRCMHSSIKVEILQIKLTFSQILVYLLKNKIKNNKINKKVSYIVIGISCLFSYVSVRSNLFVILVKKKT